MSARVSKQYAPQPVRRKLRKGIVWNSLTFLRLGIFIGHKQPGKVEVRRLTTQYLDSVGLSTEDYIAVC
jgi:hypothetical protein